MSAPAPEAAPVEARGDVELSRSLVDSLGNPEASPDAGVTAYLSHLVGTLAEWLGDALSRTFETLPVPAGLGRAAAFTLLTLLAAWLLFVLIRWSLRRGRQDADAGSSPAPVRTEEGAPVPDRGAAAWRRRLDEHLAGGRVAEALEALWWWLARSLVGERADPSWTAAELVRASERTDLAPLLRHLEAFEYGPVPPRIDDVEALTRRLEGALS